MAVQPGPNLPKLNILAVDDDPDVLQLVELIFRREKLPITVATSGAAALDYVDTERPDVILLDLMMPEMDGFTVLQRLKRRVRAPLVVCLTAKSDLLSRERAWRLGIDEYVTKPFAVPALVDAVRTVIGRSWPERQSHRREALDALVGAV